MTKILDISIKKMKKINNKNEDSNQINVLKDTMMSKDIDQES
jgi:hypothetical protein